MESLPDCTEFSIILLSCVETSAAAYHRGGTVHSLNLSSKLGTNLKRRTASGVATTMSNFQPKVIKREKKQETMICIQDKKLVEINCERTWMLDSAKT